MAVAPKDLVEVIHGIVHVAANKSAEVKKAKANSSSRRKNIIPIPVRDACYKARRVHHLWKSEGKPAAPHSLAVLRRKTKKAVCAAQRRCNAEKRTAMQ